MRLKSKVWTPNILFIESDFMSITEIVPIIDIICKTDWVLALVITSFEFKWHLIWTSVCRSTQTDLNLWFHSNQRPSKKFCSNWRHFRDFSNRTELFSPNDTSLELYFIFVKSFMKIFVNNGNKYNYWMSQWFRVVQQIGIRLAHCGQLSWSVINDQWSMISDAIHWSLAFESRLPEVSSRD